MNKELLQKLALKYLSGTATEEEKRKLHEWYDTESPEAAYWENIESREMVKSRIFRKLKSRIKAEKSEKKSRAGRFPLTKIAAVFFIVLAVGLSIKYGIRERDADWLTVNVPFGEIREVLLPDSTIVWINAGSEFSYPSRFDKEERKVKLTEGQAFFDVKRDTARPFFVTSGDMQVSVLGTSFDIKSYSEEPLIKVGVLTGLVRVDYGGNERGATVNLVAGEEGTVNRKEGHIRKDNLETEWIAAWRDQRLVFDDESMKYVVSALERRYDIDVEVISDQLLSETLSIKLDNQPLTDVLEVLKYSMGFEYRRTDDGKIQIYESVK